MRVAILAHDEFPDRAKTAIGVLRYGDHEVAAVLDRATAPGRVRDHVREVQDAPIVSSFDAVDGPVDALYIGISPIGGAFEEHWRPDVRAALERGCDVVSGLHDFLSDDEELRGLAARHGGELRDVRKPPGDLSVADGTAGSVDATVVLTVGTDCSTGKMTTSKELVLAAQDRGIDAAMVPTGQTGIMIEDWGIPIDRTVSDFTAGAVERLVHEAAPDNDLLVVEGQGAIVHPAYSGVTLATLHGAMPDALVLSHQAGRTAIHGYESFSIPDLAEVVSLYEDLAAPLRETAVVAGALNTDHLDEAAARTAVDEYEETIGVPATDPVRFDPAPILDAIT